MNRLSLVRRGLKFYRRTHLGVIAGCAVSSAVLVGALFVGDSVRESLSRIARERLGRIEIALDAGNRRFRDDLPRRIGADLSAALRVQGMALREGGRQVNRVDVIGIEPRFLDRAEVSPGISPGPGKVALNGKLASVLGAKVGDEISLRLFKPGVLPGDAPLASAKDRNTRRRSATVVAILTDAQLGRFSLKSDQTAPYNAFVDLAWLQEALEADHRANIVVGAGSAEAAQAALKSVWTLEDAGLSLRSFEKRALLQLQSDRIYLDPGVADRAMRLSPDATGALSYLVNSITSERGASTPYSFMTAVSPSAGAWVGPVPADMKDDEILVNRWTAEKLAIREGDRVKVAYYEFTGENAYLERERGFRVRGILEMGELMGEKELVPEFPGLTDVESCKDWDIRFPTEEKKLKDEANEDYWKKHRQTPKAFVTLAAGRSMWANRYGDIMAVRYLLGPTTPNQVRDGLRAGVDPGELGLVFRPVRAQAMQAASESMDLGQLFLGMSLFLIAASLILTGMLFVFSVEQRAREMGVLLAVGFTPARVRRLFLLEGGFLALAGSIAGVPLGWVFAKALLWGLGGAWSGAIAEASIAFHATGGSAAAGAIGAVLISLIAMALALRRQARRPVRELVAEDLSVSQGPTRGKGRLRLAVFIGGTLGGLGSAGWALAAGGAQAAEGFFAAGALLLVGGLAGVRMLLARLSARTEKLSVKELGVRNAARRPGRSLATAAMLACGCFMVFSVSAMKEDLSRQATERRSGTGGFALYAESSFPVAQDLNDPKGRAALRLTDKAALEGVSFLPLRLHEGDDASCLNLNNAPAPTLLGVDPAKLASLGAFAGKDVWSMLDAEDPEGTVPALVGDSATAIWKLRKKVGPRDGDVLEYRDERGRTFKVRMVGALPERLTVLQGRLLISNRHFTRLYPSEGGFRVFLIDGPIASSDRLMAHLTERLETVGLDAVRAVDRLREFYAVESAYLQMFLVLGGLGLLLGSAGMGVLVLRNVMERRGELALLRAVGYTKDRAAQVVLAEHRFLLAAGLGTGTIASALALIPSLAQPSQHAPYGLLAAFLLGTTILSMLWIRLATGVALRAPLTPALRKE